MEFCVAYTNDSLEAVENVIVRVSLPYNMEYVPGSTRLVNQTFLDGISTKEEWRIWIMQMYMLPNNVSVGDNIPS